MPQDKIEKEGKYVRAFYYLRLSHVLFRIKNWRE